MLKTKNRKCPRSINLLFVTALLISTTAPQVLLGSQTIVKKTVLNSTKKSIAPTLFSRCSNFLGKVINKFFIFEPVVSYAWWEKKNYYGQNKPINKKEKIQTRYRKISYAILGSLANYASEAASSRLCCNKKNASWLKWIGVNLVIPIMNSLIAESISEWLFPKKKIEKKETKKEPQSKQQQKKQDKKNISIPTDIESNLTCPS